MTLISILKRTEKFAIDNSPMLLTAMGIVGTVTTAYLTGKAAFKAADIINQEEYAAGMHSEPWPRFKERASVTWKCYIPAVGTGVLTIVCILGANRIGTRRSAAMAAAYSISEKAFSEYKEKVIEKIGEPKERSIREAVAQDQVDRDPVTKSEVLIIGNGEVLCYDAFTGRYFNSSVEAIKKAQNDLNYQLLNNTYASLSDFYSLIGLPHTAQSEEVGWNQDKLLEIEFSTCLSDDGRPCISIGFAVSPTREYYRFH